MSLNILSSTKQDLLIYLKQIKAKLRLNINKYSVP
jgi:hypothetical protein